MTRKGDGDPDDEARADTIASDAGSSNPGAAAPAAAPGTQLGRYVLADELGAGGMATVYRARDTELRRDVAVKVLFPHLARKPEVTRRFHREARAAAGLEHPNILRVYDVGAGATPYIVMELVRGVSLRDVGEADGALLAELVACIGALLCDALAVAHRAGIVHRDVKPGNVMLADDGRLLLADFGVARLDDDDSLVTRTGALLGTPSFMAPEQAVGQTVDARSDLYSVGVTLYQLGTGSLPYSGGTARILAEATKGAVPALRRHPAIGGELSRLIARLMAPDRADRPADAATVAAELRDLARLGGLGEAVDEVRAFATDRAAWNAARRPVVVKRVVERAEEAAARGAIAPALALCDRALALEAGNVAATALVERLTRASGRRRVMVGAGIAIAVVAAAGGGVVMMRKGGEAAVVAADAGTGSDSGTGSGSDSGSGSGSDSGSDSGTDSGSGSGSGTDSGTGTGSGSDPGSASASLPDAGLRLRDASPDAPRDFSRRDASLLGLAVDAGLPAVDAPSLPVDAAPREPAIDASLAPGRVTFVFDTWCDLAIDGEPRGRADASRPIELSPGRHRAECKQGLGQGAWSDTITVAAGAALRVEGSLLPPIEVENGLADTVRIRGVELARGARASLRPGPQRIERLRDGKVVGTGWVNLPPRVARCTLRDTPELDCYP